MEDGNGVALCTWARHGHSVVSGDCAPSIMGSDASTVCVELYAMPTYRYASGDGTIDVPDGPALIAECQQDTVRMTKTERNASMLDCMSVWVVEYHGETGK